MREKQPVAETNPLSENETGNLLKRIPPVKTETGDQTDFAKRAGTLPAPKNGRQIPVKFPAAEQINPTNTDATKSSVADTNGINSPRLNPGWRAK
jgi:hypothetical protein